MRVLIFILGITIGQNSIAFDRVFYCIYQDDLCIKSHEPVKIDKPDINGLLNRVSVGEQNFIGFVDEDGVVIQFYVDAPDNIWIEIPSPEEKGSYGKQIHYREMKSIVKDLKPPYMRYIERLDLIFGAW